ncbi:phosphotransferase [Selenomonas sp. KH1T6]|uniref:phosphotransferase n=1 Tax=Selenomonas sp. KH1T6 TaxID=3158784 RepID=UPI0008A7DBB4|nr:Thiamine kinase [Selenomonas ruminantium]
MITNTNLGGHSGCQILLCEDESGETFVRKISSSIDYNERLIVQKKKQESFHDGLIKVPQVLRDGYISNGLYYFDMEYVHGITLAEYIKEVEVSEIKGIVDILISSARTEKDCQSGAAAPKAFQNKIKNLKRKLSKLDNGIINEAIEILASHDWSKILSSACHGDMTLENIIVRNNELYLIDFLDSFFDSWVFDLSTILQDVEVLWHYRDEKIDNNTVIRLIIMRDLLFNKLQELMGADYIEVYYTLLLKLIRIYPYTKDELTYNFLNKKTREVMDFIKGENLEVAS